MGLITPVVTATQTFGQPPVTTPWAPVPSGATSIDVVMRNLSSSNQGIVVRLYSNTVQSLSGATQVGIQSVISAYPGPVATTFSLSGVTDPYIAGWWGMSSPTFTSTSEVWLEDGFSYCQYGTQPKGSTTRGIIITTGLIDLMLVAIGVGPWAAIVFDTFVGQTLWGGQLCADLPPLMPNFVDSDFIGGLPNVADPRSRDKFWTALQCVAWPYFCQCNPGPGGGSPAPHDPPPPVWIKPDPAPDGPTIIDCDGTDLCALFNSLARQIAAQSAQISRIDNITTLIQRQEVPFAYIDSTAHSGLSGDGELAVQGLIGVSVAFTTVPGNLGLESGTPQANLFLGRINFGTAEGWERREVLTANPQLILPISGAFTRVGYSLTPGVVATITELVREP